MTTHDDTLTVREARATYFAENGFGDGGYDARWVRLQAGPIPLYFPNTQARVRAVRYHDIHHVLTRYATTWIGEGEIAAWELASSCADYYAAAMLNLSAMAIGLALSPGAVFRAFVRGRHSDNLYGEAFDDHLLSDTVGSVRQRLRLDNASTPATLRDRAAFLGWAMAGICTLASGPLVLGLALVLLASR